MALDRVRPGLAERAAEDAAWLARFPAILRSLLIPATVVAIPIVFAAARAFDTKLVNAVVYTFRIQDVYLESIPFLVIAGAIGLAAPTLGVLFLASHAIADLGAAFLQPKELQPLLTAVPGRAVSFWLLYLLVAELPIAVHEVGASVRRRLRGLVGKIGAITLGALAGTALTWVWGIGAPLLIRPVFTWSDLKAPTANAGWPLLVASDAFALMLGAATLALFAVRYLVLPATTEPIEVRGSSGRAGVRSLAFGVVVPIALFSSVVTQPIDALVLVTAVLVARPVSSLVLRRVGLARPLAIIPRPVRLLAGVAVSFAVGFVIVTVLGVSTLSAFFTMVVAMAVSFVLTRIMLDADDFAPSAAASPSLATGIGASVTMGIVIWLFTAGAASADNIAGQTDGWGTAAAAAAAAAGAGGLAAASANRNNKKQPNPPPWYVPDSMAEFFGYDAPPKSPPDSNKPRDPKKPPPDWPKQRPPGSDY